jgi:CDP-diacylglycerol--serine O-phosphatidyltransferase
MNVQMSPPNPPLDAESLPIDEHVEDGHDSDGRSVIAASTYCRTCSRTANLFAGFYAIVNAMNGNFYVLWLQYICRSWCWMVSMGVARLTITRERLWRRV